MKNGHPHSKPSPLMGESTVKDPPLFTREDYARLSQTNFITELSKRYRCRVCGKFVNPAMAEIFREHQH